MAADLNTIIKIQGTSEELLSMLKVLKKFGTEKLERYRDKHDCGYIEQINVSGPINKQNIEGATNDELMKLVSDCITELTVTASGPYGYFFEPNEVRLFEELAEAAPNSFFTGRISGFITGADVSQSAELKDRKLYLSDYVMNDETLPEIYVDETLRKLPYSKFCRLFKINKEDFDSDSYGDFIMEVSEEGFPTEMDYDTFLDYCDSSEIDEDKYEAAIEKINELGVTDYETFCDSINEDDFSEKRVYDPVTKTYQK
nr:hypothetical protein [Clostridia bacterium]